MASISWSAPAVLTALFLGSLSCASPPEIYEPTHGYYAARQVEFDDPPQIEEGRRLAVVDGLNHYLLSLPVKLLLWNWRLHDHDLPSQNRLILERYLSLNRLESVKVRHNQYDPIGEFRRLTRNKAVGAGYRYTLGLLGWLQYTIFPGRLFGGVPLPIIGTGDHFNPFTNTINVYSSDLGVLLHEAGHAKDYLQHEAKGTSFVLLRFLPGVDLIQEAKASNDAIRFLQCVRIPAEELRAYRTLIPAYSTYIGGYFRGGLIVYLPVVAAGHITGRAQARARLKAMVHRVEFPQDHVLSRSDFLLPFCTPVLPEGAVTPDSAEDAPSPSSK